MWSKCIKRSPHGDDNVNSDVVQGRSEVESEEKDMMNISKKNIVDEETDVETLPNSRMVVIGPYIKCCLTRWKCSWA